MLLALHNTVGFYDILAIFLLLVVVGMLIVGIVYGIPALWIAAIAIVVILLAAGIWLAIAVAKAVGKTLADLISLIFPKNEQK